MSKEAMKLALKQAFDLGQTYWSWADSEYQSHWKKADAAKERFNQLVEDTISKALAAQQTDWEAVAADQAMTIALLKAEQPAQQEQDCHSNSAESETQNSLTLMDDMQAQQQPYCWMSPEGTIYQASDEDVLKGSIPMYLGKPPAQKECEKCSHKNA
jgi:hypothetical protein